MPGRDTWARGVIALFVVVLTFLMTRDQPLKQEQLIKKSGKTAVEKRETKVPPIPKEVETIFVLAVGYYFAERKKTEPLRQQRALKQPDAVQRSAAFGELRFQFVFAIALIAATIYLFFDIVEPVDGGIPGYRLAVDATWIAGVALGVAFFFKNTQEQDLDDELGWYRLIIALVMVGMLVVMYLVREKSVSAQWLTLVLVVITFYFGQRK
jgi:phosphoglycerol transferase MdoB-like AlkP superfamily enzyme